ncbi:MAG: hypothetical protein RLZZ546_281 [Bacteroidota bacterium]
MNTQNKHLSDRVLVYAIMWSICYVFSIFALKTLDVTKEVGIVLTIVTALAFAVFAYKYYRNIFFMDEVQIKIQMEAVVIAFSLSLFLLMILGLLDLFIVLSKDDWSYLHLFPMFITFYFFGLFISNKKYNFEDEKHN